MQQQDVGSTNTTNYHERAEQQVTQIASKRARMVQMIAQKNADYRQNHHLESGGRPVQGKKAGQNFAFEPKVVPRPTDTLEITPSEIILKDVTPGQIY